MARDGGLIVAELLNGISVPVYPQVAPQESDIPYVLFRISGGEFPRSLSGDGAITQQLANIEIYASSRGAANTIEQEVSSAMANQRGTIAGAFVHSVYEEPANYDYRVVTKRDGSGGFWHITAYTYRITFDEA